MCDARSAGERVADLRPPAPTRLDDRVGGSGRRAPATSRAATTSADEDPEQAQRAAATACGSSSVERSTPRRAGAGRAARPGRRCRRTSRSRPDVTAVGAGQPLALEEADVDRHPREVRGQREVHVAGRELHHVDRARTAAGPATEPSVARACVSRGSCATTNAEHDPAPGGIRDRRRARRPSRRRSRPSSDRRRREHEQRDLDRRPPGDAAAA